jgi:CubicO group peptidase (beta-lactamase class C family)
MTKIVTTIAVLQLVEAGTIPLDDADFIAKHAPEISKKLVYADGMNGVKQERSVTMRMLLAHTAGFGYTFLDPRVNVMGTRPVCIDEFAGDERDVVESPLLNQPGTLWEYGVRIFHGLSPHNGLQRSETLEQCRS